MNGISVSGPPKIGERPYPKWFHPVEIPPKFVKIQWKWAKNQQKYESPGLCNYSLETGTRTPLKRNIADLLAPHNNSVLESEWLIITEHLSGAYDCLSGRLLTRHAVSTQDHPLRSLLSLTRVVLPSIHLLCRSPRYPGRIYSSSLRSFHFIRAIPGSTILPDDPKIIPGVTCLRRNATPKHKL